MMKKTLDRILVALTFCLLAAMCVFAVACTGEPPEIVSIEVSGAPEGNYTIGEAYDFSQLTVKVLYSDGSEKIFDGDDIEYSGWDTSTPGEKTLTVSFGEKSQTFSYTVLSVSVTLDFNGGKMTTENGDLTSLEVDASELFVDLTEFIPVKTGDDGYGMAFAGWFTDPDCTERAKIVANTYTATESVTLYAGYDTDWSWLFEYTIDYMLGEVTIDHFQVETLYSDDRFFSMGDTLTFPATIELYPVTVIGDDFLNSDIPSSFFIASFSKVVFDENSSLREIGRSAFESAQNFVSIELPSSLETIGERAFCSSSFENEQLVIPASVEKIMDEAFSYTNFEQIIFEEGSQLTIIGKEAFSGASANSIVLPDGLQEIGSSAFAGCPNITEINLPASVTKIGLYAFNSMNALQSIIVDDNNPQFTNNSEYDTHNNLYQYADDNQKNVYLLRYCTADILEKFVVPANTVRIQETAFNVKDLTTGGNNNGYSYLKEIDFSQCTLLDYIGDKAFAGISASFVLPASLKNIGQMAFYDWEGAAFEVDENNTKFASINGVLYSKDGTSLYCVPINYQAENGEFVIGENVSVIKSYAFDKCKNITYITIPANSALVNGGKVEESGLCIYTMPKLKALYILCGIFTLENGALGDKNATGNYSPSIYVSDRNAFATAWADYEEVGSKNYGIFAEIPLSERLLDCAYGEKFICDYLKSELGFVSYAAYKAGVEMFTRLSCNIYTWSQALKMLSALYNGGYEVSENYLDYFKNVESYIYQEACAYFENYFYSVSLMSTKEIDVYEDMCTRYSLLPTAVRSAVAESYELLAGHYDDVKALVKEREDTIAEIMAFDLSEKNLDNSSSEYSIAALETLLDKCNANMAADYSSNSDISQRYYMLKCSYLMWQVVNYGKDSVANIYDADNIDATLSDIYNSYINNYGLGIDFYFEYTFTYEGIRATLYKYEEYLECVDLLFCNYLMYALSNELYWDASDELAMIYDGNYWETYNWTFITFPTSVEDYLATTFADDESREKLLYLESYLEVKAAFDKLYPDRVITYDDEQNEDKTEDIDKCIELLNSVDYLNYDEETYHSAWKSVEDYGVENELAENYHEYYGRYLICNYIEYCKSSFYLETDDLTSETIVDFYDGGNFYTVRYGMEACSELYKTIVGEEAYENSYYKTMLDRMSLLEGQYTEIVESLRADIKLIDYTDDGGEHYRNALKAYNEWEFYYFYTIVNEELDGSSADFDYYSRFEEYREVFENAEKIAEKMKELFDLGNVTVENYKSFAFTIFDSVGTDESGYEVEEEGLETLLDSLAVSVYFETTRTEAEIEWLLDTFAGLGEGSYAKYKQLLNEFETFGETTQA